jgi:signal transduction histidine kinase
MKMDDSKEAIERDIAAVSRIDAVPSLLRIICQHTGMGFAAVARVTEGTWTACAVQDDINFGLTPGGQLQVHTTLCSESRASREPIVIDHASLDPVYCNHHTPRIYHIESYISVPIVRPDGTYFGNLCAIDPRPAQVSDARIVSMFTAFAELIALQLESDDRHKLVDAALMSERATAELREQFIAVLGHDLRSPLAAITVAAELLRRRFVDPDVIKLGDRLRSSAGRMSRLIDDVLDFTRGRLGSGIGVSIEDAEHLAAGFDVVIAEIREANPDRDIVERIDIHGTVRCDPVRMQQLLSNLLGNAIAHGAPDQAIAMEAKTESDYLVLSVANGGDPILPEDLSRIFQPYWRPVHSKPGGGLGLGLHICSQIVKAHNGVLEVTSTAEAGTRFVARLPRM